VRPYRGGDRAMKRWNIKSAGALLALILVAGAAWGAALTADRNTQLKLESSVLAYPVKASTTVYKGSLVCVNTSGYALPCADTASYLTVGIAEEKADNAAGAAADINVSVRAGVVALLNATSITQAMVGSRMYVVDDNTVDDSAGSNGISAGILQRYVSSTSGWVYITPPRYVTNVTATAAEINALTGTGLDSTELGFLNAVVAGTAAASKAVVLTTNRVIDYLDITTLKANGVDVTNAVIGAAGGKKVNGGTVTLDGSNPSSFAHGMTTVVACQLTDVRSTAPGDEVGMLTYVVNGANIDVYAWMNTSGTDPTLVASTDSNDVIAWICFGT
jgi:hypothetical protein